MNVSVENDIKIIEMGDKGPNLLSVERAKRIMDVRKPNECQPRTLQRFFEENCTPKFKNTLGSCDGVVTR